MRRRKQCCILKAGLVIFSIIIAYAFVVLINVQCALNLLCIWALHSPVGQIKKAMFTPESSHFEPGPPVFLPHPSATSLMDVKLDPCVLKFLAAIQLIHDDVVCYKNYLNASLALFTFATIQNHVTQNLYGKYALIFGKQMNRWIVSLGSYCLQRCLRSSLVEEWGQWRKMEG